MLIFTIYHTLYSISALLSFVNALIFAFFFIVIFYVNIYYCPLLIYLFVYYCFFFKYSLSFSFIRLSYYFIPGLFSYWFCCSLLPLLLFVLFVDLFLSFLLFVIVFASLFKVDVTRLTVLDVGFQCHSFVGASCLFRATQTNAPSISSLQRNFYLLLLSFIFLILHRFLDYFFYFLFHFNSSTHQYLDLRFIIK